MKKNKPDEISYCKHLAFQAHYKHFGNKWYMMIVPQWFISYDGYRQSFYGSDKISYIKRMEKNHHVFNHLRFIVYTLSHDKPSTLFKRRYPYPFSLLANSLALILRHSWMTRSGALVRVKRTGKSWRMQRVLCLFRSRNHEAPPY